MVCWCIPAYDYAGTFPGVCYSKAPLSNSIQKRFESLKGQKPKWASGQFFLRGNGERLLPNPLQIA